MRKNFLFLGQMIEGRGGQCRKRPLPLLPRVMGLHAPHRVHAWAVKPQLGSPTYDASHSSERNVYGRIFTGSVGPDARFVSLVHSRERPEQEGLNSTVNSQ